MSYVQKSQAVNICIRKNGSEMLLDGGTVTLPVIGGNTTTMINNSAYTYDVTAIRIYNNNSTPPVTDILGASSVVSGSFLFTAIPNNGDYIDIYNKTHGIDSRLRISFYRVSGGIYEYSFNIIYQGQSYNINGGGIPAYGGSPERGLKLGVSLDDTYPRGCIYVFRGYAGNSPFYQLDGLWSSVSQTVIACRAAVSDIFGELAPEPPGPPPSDEPYGDDDYTESQGGMGPMDDSSDTIEDGVLPLATATMSGMCTVWVPNWGEIQSVANALLSPNIAQILAGNVVKFSDVIIGLSIFPCPIDATNTGTVTANVLGIEIGTGVTCHIADNQYIEINCGTLDVDEYWCNCLDYNPYTRISIYLPFCGTYELDTDEVMGKTLGVTYRIDIFSGACLATIKIDGSIYYQYAGQCSAQIPISSVSFDNFLSSMLELGVATATGIGAVGAAGGAASAVKEEMFVPQSKSDLRSHTEEIASAEQNYTKVKEKSGSSIADAAVGAVMGSKGFYQHAGAMGGSPGFMGVRKPYLIIKRPEQLIPSMYGKFHGFPCNTTAVLGDLTGYTQVDDIRLNIPEATVDEIIECEQLLKGGVVI